MRVGEVEYIICKALRNLKPVRAYRSELNRRYNIKEEMKEDSFAWINWEETKNTLLMLQKIPITRALSEKILKSVSEARMFKDEYPELNSSQIESVNKDIRQMLSILQDLKDTYGEVNCENDTVGFDVKLPPNISFGDFAKCVKDLDTAFSQCPTLKSDMENIQFSGVDVGSTWLAFTIIGVTATVSYILKNLADIIDKIVVIRSHIITCKQQQEAAKKAGIANDYLTTLIDFNKTFQEKLEENAVNELCESSNVTDPEERQRFRHSFNLLSEWMEKGMQIYASIDSSEDIKTLFPTVEAQSLPEKVIKLLEEVNESKNKNI